MDDEAALRQFIKNSIIDGYSRTETLKLISFNFFYKNFFSLGSAQKTIDQFERNKEDVPSELHLILTILCEEFEKAKYSFDQRACPCADRCKCRLKAITERYALDMEKEAGEVVPKLYLLDGIYGQKRQLRLEADQIHLHYKSQIKTVDAEHFLIVTSTFDWKIDGSLDLTYVYLLKLDISELKCTFLDKIELWGRYEWLAVDMEISRHFVVTVFRSVPEHECLYAVNIDNDKLTLAKTLLSEEQDMPRSGFKVEGNKIIEVSDAQYRRVVFTEISLESNEIQRRRLWEFETTREMPDFRSVHTFWFEDCLYVLRKLDIETKQLLKYDTRNQQVTLMLELNLQQDFQLCDFRIDNGILTVWNLNALSKQHRCLKFTLSQPEKLVNLTLKELNQQMIFMEENEQNALIQKIPQKLRPFGKER